MIETWLNPQKESSHTFSFLDASKRTIVTCDNHIRRAKSVCNKILVDVSAEITRSKR